MTMTLDTAADLLEPGPFDATAALEAITQQNREVKRARVEWEAFKEAASHARKAWEGQMATLEALIADFERQAREATEPPLPFVDVWTVGGVKP